MLLMLLLAGYIATKANIINDAVAQGMSGFVVQITIPMMILATAGAEAPAGSRNIIFWILIGTVIYYVVGIFLFTGIGKLTKFGTRKNALFVNLVVMGNVAFVGYPIITVFLPETGIFFATFFVLLFNFIQYTYGMSAMSGTRGFSARGLLTNTTVIAVLITVALMLLKVRIPAILTTSFTAIGGLSTPLGFLVLGNILAGMKLRSVFDRPFSYLISAIRMLVFPTLIFLAVVWLKAPYEAAVVLVVIGGVPCALSTSLFAKIYDNDTHFATATVLLSSILFLPCSFYLAFLVTKL